MAWTIQYYHEFKNADGVDCDIRFYKDAAVANIEIMAGESPVTGIKPRIKNKFQVVRGGGAQFNLISATDRQLEGLFTAGAKTIIAVVRVNSTVDWVGYVDSEQYAEPYAESFNYPVQVTANDGLGLLDKLGFWDSGERYEGLMTEWDVIVAVIGEIGLSAWYSLIAVSLATTSSDITIGAQDTILHHTYVKVDNYYNEKGDSISCREILESILAPYGAFITTWGQFYIITDVHSLADDALLPFKWFTDSSGAYHSAGNMPAPLDIENDYGHYKSPGMIKRIPGRNKQAVKYNRYPTELINTDLQNTAKMSPSPTFSQISDGDGSESYLMSNVTAMEGWDFSGDTTGKMRGAKRESGAIPEYYIELENEEYVAGGGGSIDYTDHLNQAAVRTWPFPYITGNEQYYIRITGQIRALTRPDPYIEPDENFFDDAYFNFVSVGVRLLIGDRYASPFTGGPWIDEASPLTTSMYFTISGGEYEENAKNRWLPFRVAGYATPYINNTKEGILIPLEDVANGTVELDFSNLIIAKVNNTASGNESSKIIKVQIKDIKIDFIRRDTVIADTDTDIEYIGEFDEDWINEGTPVLLKHGDGSVYGGPADNGTMLFVDSGVYYPITEWTRNLTTATIEELLLKSIQSNYEDATIEVDVDINYATNLLPLRYTDDTHQAGKVFMNGGSEYDYAMAHAKIRLVEIIEDNSVLNLKLRDVPRVPRAEDYYITPATSGLKSQSVDQAQIRSVKPRILAQSFEQISTGASSTWVDGIILRIEEAEIAIGDRIHIEAGASPGTSHCDMQIFFEVYQDKLKSLWDDLIYDGSTIGFQSDTMTAATQIGIMKADIWIIEGGTEAICVCEYYDSAASPVLVKTMTHRQSINTNPLYYDVLYQAQLRVRDTEGDDEIQTEFLTVEVIKK